VRITADTNVLVRAITGDDERQSGLAQKELLNADSVALSITALCELVWVLSRGYKASFPEIAEAVRRLINADNVAVNRAAVEAGLSLLDAGGDFADGVIAFEGASLGADAFVSFDKDAVRLIASAGSQVRLLA
jgi:predicted nucleic-acid-binding protein